MNYNGSGGAQMAATGVGGVTVGGVFFQELWLLVAGVAFVVLGATCIRMGWRRNKTVGAR
jgi:hypothetical protein